MIQRIACNPGSLSKIPQKLSLQKNIKEKHQMSQFQDKGNQKSQVYKVSKKKHCKVGLGMKLIQIKVIKAQSPSIDPHCASKSLAREIGREIEQIL